MARVPRRRRRPRRARAHGAPVFEKILAFSAFGFPKAHAAAFALLAYQSAWLRRHRPAAFLCSLLNAQPMGFYPPASLVRDAERRGIEVRHPDLHRSHVEARLEDGAVRVGLGYDHAGSARRAPRRWCASARRTAPFALRARPRPPARALAGPAGAARRAPGACDELGPRRRLLWELGLAMRSAPVRGGGRQLALDLARRRRAGAARARRVGAAGRRLRARRPVACASTRSRASAASSTTSSRAADLYELPTGRRIALPGLAIARQRPASANGIVFLLLEDEFGLVNLILFPDVYERFRLLARTEPLLLTEGTLERRDRNVNVLVESLSPLDAPGHRTLAARRGRRGAALADLRAVAPPPQHFAQGRRR